MSEKRRAGFQLSEAVHEELKRRITNCVMMPGEPIFEEKLIEEFGHSRTPIREALLRLKRERLVEIWPRKGIFVKDITLKDVFQIYQMRLIIEPTTAKAVAPGIPRERLEDFRKGFLSFQTPDSPFPPNLRLDREFHDFIIDSAGNDYLSEVYAELRDLNQRIRLLSGRSAQRVQEGISEHVTIIDALLSGNEAEIEKTVSAHILNSRSAALAIEGFLHPKSPLA